MTGHVVTAAAVRVIVGRSALIVERGHSLPADVSADQVKRLVDKGMVAKPKAEPKG